MVFLSVFVLIVMLKLRFTLQQNKEEYGEWFTWDKRKEIEAKLRWNKVYIAAAACSLVITLTLAFWFWSK